MARWGRTDFKQFQRLQRQLLKYSHIDVDAFCRDVARELAARLLRKAIKRTPVDKGTLRRGWTASGNKQAHSGDKLPNAGNYANALPVVKKGNAYYITVFNPVEYAAYVEFGHRTRNHKGWVSGKFMLTESEMEVQAIAERLIQKRMMEFLGGIFDGN